jgi:hypothetical protein
MSDICSDNEKYGGFGAAVANSLHCRDRATPTGAEAADVAAPAPAVAAAQSAPTPAVAAAQAGTKKSPPVAVAKCTWLTKRPYKRQKKTLQPAVVPAPTAAPAPASLVVNDGAAARAPAEKKPHRHPAAALLPLSFDNHTHPCGILAKIVGTTVSCQGRSCKEHEICGKVLMEDVVVRLRKMQLMVEGKEETVIAVIWVTDGVDRCHIGFLPCHMVKHAARYDGALTQVIRILSDDAATCDSAEQRMFHKNKGFCLTAIISTLPGSTKKF